MKNFNSIVFTCILFSLILQCKTQGIKRVFFEEGTNKITNDTGKNQRDGIVIAELYTNENTTICNYKFDDISAGIVCKTLGFPQNGMSITGGQSSIKSPVLLANFRCTGAESSLSYCLNSGRSDMSNTICGGHTMDVHVYCVQPKLPPIIPPNTINTACNKMSATYKLLTANNIMNSGQLQVNGVNVCDDEFSLTGAAASLICNELCYNASNPSILTPLGNLINNVTTNSVKLTCTQTSCTPTPYRCPHTDYLIGLSCGEEIQISEDPPKILCQNHNMTLTWPAGFMPPINSNLITLNPNCNFANRSFVNNVTTMFIPFDQCNPSISGDANYIIFGYTVIRAYFPRNSVTPPPKTLQMFCNFPKRDSANSSIDSNVATYQPLFAETSFGLTMRFYSENSYTAEVLPNMSIDSDKLLFVKVTVVNPPEKVSLILTQCYGSFINNINALNASNSIALIQAVCPVNTYEVVISRFSKSEVRFKFKPYELSNSPNRTIYVLCRTTLCYIGNDGNCPRCGSNRRKRSIMKMNNEYVVQGSVKIFHAHY